MGTRLSLLCITAWITVCWNNVEAHESIIGGFLPYWKTTQAIESFKEHYHVFDQASPFSYDIDTDGHVVDKFQRKKDEWRRFTKFCHKHTIKVVPTIFWNNTDAIHQCLSNKKICTAHINEIITTITRDNANGVCIDYENIHQRDRLFFAQFIKEIGTKLHEKNLVLYCCVEGRISDYQTGLFNAKGRRTQPDKQSTLEQLHSSLGPAQAIHHFKKNCAHYCDQIIIMGYDEWGFPYQYSKRDYANKYFISHASIAWLKKIIHYMLSFIPAEKLVLGIPTYGLDFIIYDMNKHNITLKKHKALSYPLIEEIIQQNARTPLRTSGCELAFTYHQNNQMHYVCYLDAQAIKDRIELAHHFQLKGIYFFKIDGLEDPTLWSLINKKID